MMGVGKSTIGKKLAKKLKLKFIDIDQIIELKEKSTIREIFDKKGETYFRSIEEKVVLKTIKLPGQVIALGGGSFLNKRIRSEILKNCISFWLNCKSNTILHRISNNKKRPKLDLLNNKEILNLINLRAKVYLKANYKVNCDNLNKLQIAKKILKIYES